GDVEREGVIAPLVFADALAVDQHVCFPVDRPEMQEQTLVLEVVRFPERPAVPEALVRPERLLTARQGRLDGERNEDASLVRLRSLPGRGGRDGILPEAVEVDPGLPRHLWARVLRERVGGIDILGEAAEEAGSDLPLTV